jgi:hypothetical protein
MAQLTRSEMSTTERANHWTKVWNYAYDVVRANAIAAGSTTRAADKARLQFLVSQGINTVKMGRSNMIVTDDAVFNAAVEVV